MKNVIAIVVLAVVGATQAQATDTTPCDYNTTGCVLKQYSTITVDNGPVRTIGRK